MNELNRSMKKFSKIANPADVIDSQHFLQLKKIFLIHQDDNNYSKCMRMRCQLFTLRLTAPESRQSQLDQWIWLYFLLKSTSSFLEFQNTVETWSLFDVFFRGYIAEVED